MSKAGPLYFFVLMQEEICYDIISCQYEKINTFGKYGIIANVDGGKYLIKSLSMPWEKPRIFYRTDLHQAGPIDFVPIILDFFIGIFCSMKRSLSKRR